MATAVQTNSNQWMATPLLYARPIAFFDNNKTGELVNRLGNDITMTSRVLIDASAGIRSSITALVGTCLLLEVWYTHVLPTILECQAFVVDFPFKEIEHM